MIIGRESQSLHSSSQRTKLALSRPCKSSSNSILCVIGGVVIGGGGASIIVGGGVK